MIDLRKIKEYREQLGLTPKQVAARAGMDLRTYRRHEADGKWKCEQWIKLDDCFRIEWARRKRREQWREWIQDEQTERTAALLFIHLIVKAGLDPKDELAKHDVPGTAKRVLDRLPDDGSEKTAVEHSFLNNVLYFADHSSERQQAQTVWT